MIVTLIINTTRNIQILHGVRVWMIMTTYQISPPELFDSPLSEKLQMDAELTLEKAITVVRQSEAVRKQQTVLRGSG